MKIFRRNIYTAAQTTSSAAVKAAESTARKVEFAKNTLAIYGAVRLGLDIFNAIKVAKMIKSGEIYQGEDGYWYYTDTHSDDVEGGDEEEAQ